MDKILITFSTYYFLCLAPNMFPASVYMNYTSKSVVHLYWTPLPNKTYEWGYVPGVYNVYYGDIIYEEVDTLTRERRTAILPTDAPDLTTEIFRTDHGIVSSVSTGKFWIANISSLDVQFDWLPKTRTCLYYIAIADSSFNEGPKTEDHCFTAAHEGRRVLFLKFLF